MDRKSTVLTLILGLLTNMAFAQINVSFEQYRLDNGLTVIAHEDHSAPITAVVVMYHVGSKNEKIKRTGFAHLFEHVMFKGSEHVADGEHFKLLQEVGANINGFTTEDGTTYFEVVPSNYVELGLYLESDRMGFLLSAVTQEKLDNQRDVVKNERRQRVDNVPYGTAEEKITKALYPETHPYSWPVIGYMEDLSAASLADVQDFFKTYYAPNNACLVVAGDFNPAEVKTWVEKYFGSIPRGKDFQRPAKVPVSLNAEKRMVLEDKVQLPRLYLTWHTTPSYTRDHAVMNVLANILSRGKNSRLFKSMVYDKQIAQTVFATQSGFEIAGTFGIQATAKPGHSLTELQRCIDSLLQVVMTGGVTQAEIDKALTAAEVSSINGLATVLGKATALASAYSYAGDPTWINRPMKLYEGITPAEVLATAKHYLAQPGVSLSVVPIGKPELAAKRGE